jgi:hypothetical protein
MAGIPKLGAHVSVSTIVEKFKVVGSIARMLLRKCLAEGSLGQNDVSSRQFLCYPKVQVAAKVEVAKKEVKEVKGKKDKKEKEK